MGIQMKKMVLAAALMVMAQSTLALEASSKTTASIAVEVVFSTAITSVTSEISVFSTSDVQRKDARKILADVQDYNQTGYITLFLGEKIAIIKDIDPSLSNDESVDVLLEASEFILAN